MERYLPVCNMASFLRVRFKGSNYAPEETDAWTARHPVTSLIALFDSIKHAVLMNCSETATKHNEKNCLFGCAWPFQQVSRSAAAQKKIMCGCRFLLFHVIIFGCSRFNVLFADFCVLLVGW